MSMYIAIFISVFATIAFVALTATLFASTYRAQKSGAPFYSTSKNAIREALKEAKLQPGELFYDLGAGTGKALLVAEKEFGARATGFEISIIFYCIGKLNLFLHHSHSKLIKENLFSADLKNTDVVFCFLFPPTMQKMETKLKAELKPGTRIIVYAFPLPTMQPIKMTTIHGKWNMFFYHIN